jgi:hypothetical protein
MPTKTICDTDSTQTLTNKTLTAPTITAGVVALAAAPTATLDAATKGYVDGLNINPLNNGSLAATVASNILTVHLKTAGGAVPSSSDPVRVTFRNTTDNDGSLVTRTVTGTTTMTCSSGSTLGTSNGVTARLWVGLIDNSGTVEVCIWNPYLTTSSNLSLKGFTPNTDETTTAEGSGTATLAHTLYSTNARSSVPFVLLGFIEVSEATAGVWATAPTVVQTYRDGYRKTGDIVQNIWTATGTVASGATVMPNDNTTPQNTEGDQYMTLAVTPTSAVNILEIRHLGSYSNDIANAGGIALFQDSTVSAIASSYFAINNTAGTFSLHHRMLSGTTSSTTFKIRTGGAGSGGGTITFNGGGATGRYNGTINSNLHIMEIYV